MLKAMWTTAALVALVAAAPASSQTTSVTALVLHVHGNIAEATQLRYRTVFEDVITFYRQEFGDVPVPIVRIRLYENIDLYAQGLMDAFGYSAATARTNAETFNVQIVDRETIAVDVSRQRDPVFVISHELVHLMQWAWIGRKEVRTRFPSWKWLVEGMADFYSERFREWKGIRPYSVSRQRWIDAIRLQWPALSARPLVHLDDWGDATRRYGRGPNGLLVAYAYAFLAYEYLEARTSRQAVLAFLAAIRSGLTREDAFRIAFGITHAEFERDLKSFIPTLF